MKPADFPLCWPDGQPRTLATDRIKSPYRRTFKAAYNALFDAAKRFHDKDCGFDLVISTSVPLSAKDLPIVSLADRVGDPGVAVYLFHEGRPYAFAEDEFREIRENLNALAKTLEGYWLIHKHAWILMRSQSMVGFQRQVEAVVESKMPRLMANGAV